ncbi:MAG: sugar phosphate isomerase/epimerase [Clostridia bacterium]|nr:sugar phosphate isomerase/epimerase [Clostridia bacterium]
MERKISLAICDFIPKYGLEKTLDIAKEVGADGIDFDLNRYNLYGDNDSIYLKSDAEIEAHFKAIREEVEKRGLVVFQTHGTMRTFMENDEEYNTVVFPKNAEGDLKAARILGAKYCVFHPGSDLSNPNATPEEMRFRARRAFKSILPFAKENGVKVALETVGSNWNLGNKLDFFGAYDEFKALFDDVRMSEFGEWFVCCIDTGHINLTAQHNEPSAAEFVRKLGKNVACLHLHDNFGIVDHHRVIGAGTTDWTDFFKALKEVGYEGVYNSEANFGYISDNLMIATADFTVKTIKSFASRY